MVTFWKLFLVVPLCLASKASTRKQHWQSGDEYHISHHCYTKSICLLQMVLLNWSIMSPIQTHGYWSSVQTFILVNGARRHLFVPVIDRYVTFHDRSSLISACKLCSKPSWWCMGTLGSTMLTVPLRWVWEDNATGDWIPLWTTPPHANAVGMEWPNATAIGLYQSL